MKAVTVRNPIAAQVVFGMERAIFLKEGTRYRGPVLIHAAATLKTNERLWDLPHEELLQRVIGVVELADVARANTGWHQWRFVRPLVFAEPVLARGLPGLWEIDGDDIAEQMEKAMTPAVAKVQLGYDRRMDERIADSVHPRRRDGWVGD
jgi:hypothetical protein